MKQETVVIPDVLKDIEKTVVASRKLRTITEETIRNVLTDLATLLLEESDDLLAANRKDLVRMDQVDPKYDRLELNETRLQGIARDLRNVAALPSPLDITLEERTLENGLQIRKVSVPIGVIGIVFESRPNVTFDVFSLCFKSGNAVVLKGSRDAHESNIAIVELIQRVLAKYGLADVVYLAPSDREILPTILAADNLIDMVIPRGSQGLINFVRKHSTVPVIETGAGIVHTYYDESADFEKGRRVIRNAKTRRVSVCNALDTLIIHQSRLDDLPDLLRDLDKEHRLEVFADPEAFGKLKGHYDPTLLMEADEKDFGTEFLAMKMSVKTVRDIQQCLEHIAVHSSRHSEAIVADDPFAIETFQKEVDAAAVYVNASTAFTDGSEFGLGAEIGISTQKLHARGPMGLRELTSYKWLVTGDGHIRPSQ